MSIRKRRRNRETEAQLDLTAFMNLMVIMIPSLLINAVFTQVNVLNVDQPGDGAPQSASAAIKPPLTLDIGVYPDKIVINNRGQGQIKEIAGHDFSQLNTALVDVKKQYPTVNSATLRIEETVTYQDIISTIDAVRIVESQKTGNSYALFPNVQLAGVEGST
jgi:biopolymer transport protein ExbD